MGDSKASRCTGLLTTMYAKHQGLTTLNIAGRLHEQTRVWEQYAYHGASICRLAEGGLGCAPVAGMKSRGRIE